jgi:hypothetical protein
MTTQRCCSSTGGRIDRDEWHCVAPWVLTLTLTGCRPATEAGHRTKGSVGLDDQHRKTKKVCMINARVRLPVTEYVSLAESAL